MKAKSMEISQTYLKSKLHYDSETGVFTRLDGRYEGNIAGNLRKDGYVRLKLGDREYSNHRLAFLYMVGSVPNLVDHIDGNKSNNSWKNLRACTTSQNGGNRKKDRDCSSPYKGVTYRSNKKSANYEVNIAHRGKSEYLGVFDCPINAALTYDTWARTLFGKFAKTNF